MSEILIERQGKSFWINPSFIELVSQYVCQVIASTGVNTYSPEIQEIYINDMFPNVNIILIDGTRVGY